MDTERRDDLGERLEAYARATLTPDPEAMAAIRRTLVAEASVRLAEAALPAASARPVSSPAPAPGDTPLHRWGRALHRWGAAVAGPRPHFELVQRVGFAAGTLAVALAYGFGVVAASAPGAPLYATRLWIEQVTLPSSGSARMTAEVALLDQRLAEARSAAQRGDPTALAAALKAYQETATDASLNARTDADRQLLATVLASHRAELAAFVPAPSSAGGDVEQMQAAIDEAEATIQQIEAANTPGTKPNPTPAAGEKPNATDRPSASDHPGNTPNPGKTDKPNPGKTDKPDKTPPHTPNPPDHPGPTDKGGPKD